MIKKIIRLFNPPDNWKLPAIILSGCFVGLMIYAFYLSKAYSYLSDKPETCVNCHIMGPQYSSWRHSSHHNVTTCNDCHVPHNNIFNKYFFKAKDGMRHATIFTLRLEPQVIFIHEAGQEVVQNNCLRCHGELVKNAKTISKIPDFHANIDSRKCWECHRETPHGRVNGLSSAPFAKVPVPQSPVPDWLKQLMNKEKK